MGWINYKKAYNMVPHLWLEEAVELVRLAENLKKLMFDSMERWKTILTASNQVLGKVNIKRGIFQEDTISPLLFVIVLIPLSMILREIECGYQLEKHSIKINHILFMNDLKLYGKNEIELNSLINTVHIFSQDVGMKFGMGKWKVLTMHQGRIKDSDKLKLLDGDLMKEIDTARCKYLGRLQHDLIRHRDVKQKLEEEYARRVRKLVKSKLYSKNMIDKISTWAIGVI